jgi:hypothetical protein
MENNPIPPVGNVNTAKSGGLNSTLIVIAVLVCATVLGAVYLVVGEKSGDTVVESTRPAPAIHQNNPTPLTPPGIVEKGLAVTGLQKAEGGKASADYYNKFLSEQVACQMTAGRIRILVERIDISPNKPGAFGIQTPNPNITGVRKALEVAAGYYKRSVRSKLSLSSAGIDPVIVAYVEKLANFDQAASDTYDRYASTLQSETREIEAIGKLRDNLIEKEEAALISGFESKFGIRLPTRNQLHASLSKSATDEAQQFLEKKTPQELAANLLGNSFINANDFGRWTVEAGEYVFGRIFDSAIGPGIVFVDLEVQLKGARSANPGLVRARIVYVKDPLRSVYWVVLVQDLSAR